MPRVKNPDITGKLVPQDPNDEPVVSLLKNIRNNKALLISEGKIKKQDLYPKVPKNEEPFNLPQGWNWKRLGNICSKLTDGSHNPPKEG